MTDKFVFHGQTTFIDRPRDVVIQDFQNKYITGDNPESDRIAAEIVKLVELILKSEDLSKSDKEESVQALNAMAEQVKEQKLNKLTAKGTLEAIKEVVSEAADIAVPALGIIAAVVKLLSLG